MTGTTDLLTVEERQLIDDLGQVWNKMCDVVGRGPSRDGDLQEAVLHLHALQHTVMSNAAARAYPREFRLLGEVLPR